MKAAIITGASSGLGREFVLQLNQNPQGLEEIWVIARRRERLEALQAESKLPLRIFALDLTNPEALRAYELALAEQKPQVKLLANCSGFAKLGSYEAIANKDALHMVDLNCRALVALTIGTLPYMQKDGQIIQIASSASFFPLPDMGIYAASKAFVLSYSRSLNRELKPRGITVTTVTPGPVKTEFWQVAEETYTLPVLSHYPFMAEAKAVVAKALRDAANGKDISTYGFSTKAHKLFSKLLPQRWLMSIWQRLKSVGKK